MGTSGVVTGTVRTVRQACVPRIDVLGDDLDDAIYAASLDAVARRKDAPPVYGDAATFFRNTHPSTNLRAVARQVFRHLSDRSRPGIAIRLNTGFGGGKTHALIALWHLATNSGNPHLGNDVAPAENRPSRVAVAAIDGQSLGASVVALRDGRWLRTLWHELAWQLGGAGAIARLDAVTPDDPAVLPPLDVTRSILPAGPVLILLDETVLYVAAQGGGASAEATTTLLFIRQLLHLATNTPGLVVVISDPGPQAGYRGLSDQLDARRIEDLARAQGMLASEAARAVEEVDPVGDESVAVLTRRLFESIDPATAAAVADAYAATYDRVRADHPHLVPAETVPHAYRAEIAAAYPFHPRLLKTIRERLQAIASFQRSRGTLRLFARIVKQVWQSDRDVSIITAGDLDFAVPSTRAELLDRLQRSAFAPAVAADVLGHAPALDVRFATGDAHARVARALLVESLQIDPKPSVDVADLTLAVLRPSDAGTEPAEAVRRLAEAGWHIVDLGADTYRFTVEASAMKLLEQEVERTSATDARDPVRTAVQSYLGQTPLRLVAWPRDAGVVGVAASGTLALCETLALARDVVAHQDAAPRAGSEAPRAPRLYRNTIVALAPRADLAETAYRLARRHLAAQTLEANLKAQVAAKGEGSLSAALALEQLGPTLRKLPREYSEAARQAWNQVVLPGHDPLTLTEAYVTSAFVVGATSGQQQLLRMLRDNDLAFKDDHDGLAPHLIVDRVLPGTAPYAGDPDRFTAKAVAERAYATYGLPVFIDDLPIRKGLQRAVGEGSLAVQTADGRAYAHDKVASGPVGERQVTDAAPGRELPLFPVDATTIVGRPAAASVQAWFAVPEKKPDPGGGDDDLIVPPGGVTVTTWELAKQLAQTRPLERLALTTVSATAIEDALTTARAFNFVSPRLSVNVAGAPRAGANVPTADLGDVQVTVTRVQIMQAVQMTQAIATLSRTLENPGIETELEMAFAGGDRAGASARLVAGLANEARHAIVATFGPEDPS